MGSSSRSSSDRTVIVRNAPYVEAQHNDFLQIAAGYVNAEVGDSPYIDYTYDSPELAFFGIGYTLSSFPSLYDMYGKFMAGFDLEELWQRMFSNVVGKGETADYATASEAGDFSWNDKLTKFGIDARKLNIVGSSSFVIGKSQIEKARVLYNAEQRAALRYNLLEVIAASWSSYIGWMQKVITSYALMMKNYYSTEHTYDDAQHGIAVRDKLWPLFVEDFMRRFLNALRGQINLSQALTRRKRSALSGILLIASDTVTGVYIGAQIGGYPGAIVGGVIGFVVGCASWIFE